jgi:hypothetical protein
MTENEKRTNDSSAPRENFQDEDRTAGRVGRSARDLGTTGGGPVPGGGAVSKGNNPGTGSGAMTDREEEERSEAAANAVDRRAEGNLGGRNPSLPQTPMGSQDSQSHTTSQDEIQAVDPMTSRDPGKIARDTPDTDDPSQRK